MDQRKIIPLNIFLADDDIDDRELFGEAIKETNPQTSILTFNDGNELMQHLKSQEADPDLIFLDINMPLKNGKECLSEIRSDKRFRSTPVIMFSTSLDVKDIYETYNAGANLFISKPGSYKTQVDLFKQVFDLYTNNLLVAQTITDFVFTNTAMTYGLRRTAM
jgi:CheY-like chemotaxis protein